MEINVSWFYGNRSDPIGPFRQIGGPKIDININIEMMNVFGNLNVVSIRFHSFTKTILHVHIVCWCGEYAHVLHHKVILQNQNT